MKSTFIALTGLVALWATPATAQVCTGTALGQTALTTLLNGKYACVGTFPTSQWNELHSGGSLIDYKLGASHPKDPTKNVGTYTITSGDSSGGASGRVGVVTYNYGSGGTYGYHVYANLGTISPAAGLYSFCTTGGGSNFAVKVGQTTANGGC